MPEDSPLEWGTPLSHCGCWEYSGQCCFCDDIADHDGACLVGGVIPCAKELEAQQQWQLDALARAEEDMRWEAENNGR